MAQILAVLSVPAMLGWFCVAGTRELSATPGRPLATRAFLVAEAIALTLALGGAVARSAPIYVSGMLLGTACWLATPLFIFMAGGAEPKLGPGDERIPAGEVRLGSVSLHRTSTWEALVLFLVDRPKYREYRFDRDMSRAMRPITRTPADAVTTEQSILDTRGRAIDALEGLVAPSRAWAEVRDSIVGVLRYEIDVVQGRSPADIDEHRSRSAPFVAQLQRLRDGYRIRP